MSDEGRDGDLALLNHAKCARIYRGPPVFLEPTRCAHRSHQRGFLEHHTVEYAEIDSGVTMPVEQHGGLLADQRGNCSEHATLSRGFDEIFDTTALRDLAQ